jgi:hypothetical protein
MNENKIEISQVEVGGDFTGRDRTEFHFSTKSEQTIYLRELYDKFALEKKEDAQFREICEELNYFITQNGNEEIIGLEDKLKAGNRHSMIEYAKQAKERFHKKLFLTSQYSDIAQTINVHILAKVKTAFLLQVYSVITEGQSVQVINTLLDEKIIKPLMTELGINIFNYTEQDIMGMIFFLTGNCHIKWTA